MGDARFSHPLRQVRAAEDRAAAIRELADHDVVQALAGASREQDPYLANVLATEALNRLSRKSAIVESAAQGLLTLDLSGRVLYANPAAQALANAKADALRGAPLTSLLTHDPRHPDTAATLEGLRLGIARGCTDGSRRAMLRRIGGGGGGGMRAVEWSLSPIVREGELEAIVLTLTDVGARDRTQEALDKQHRVQQMLLEAQEDLNEGLLLLEGEEVQHANQAMRSLVGEERGGLRTLADFLECVEPEARATLRCRILACGRDGPETPQRFDLRMLRRGGGQTCLEALLLRTHHGERATTLLVLRDVTLRRFIGDALRASERQLRAAFTHADVALAVLDSGGRWVRANESACDLLDVPFVRLQRRRLEDAFAPEDAPALRDALARCLDRGAAVVEGDVADDGCSRRLALRMRRAGNGAGAEVVVVLEEMAEEPEGSLPHADDVSGATWRGAADGAGFAQEGQDHVHPPA